MDNKKELIKNGVYLSDFVATSVLFFILVLAIATGFFASAYFKGASQTSNRPTVTDGQAVKTVTLADVKDVFNNAVIKFGDAKRKVIFIEASDPSCPYCSIASGQNPKLNIEAGERFKLVADGGSYVPPVVEMRKLVDSGKASYALIYRSGHGAGEVAMKALYCAFEQGKFWQAHDLIMSGDGYNLVNNTVRNNKDKTNELVAFLGSAVDREKLKSCLDSGKYDSRLAEDIKLGDSLNIGGTPGFYVNDKYYAGAYSYTDMQGVVDGFLR